MKDVVVTGLGIVSPLGNSVTEFKRRMFAGESGVINIRGLEVDAQFPVPYAAMVSRRTLEFPKTLADQNEHMNDWTRFLGLCTEEALENIPAHTQFDAIICGTAEGNHFDAIRQSLREGSSFNRNELYSETATERMAALLKYRGHPEVPQYQRLTLNSACATGNMAIGIAMQRIRSGEWKRVLVACVDARCTEPNFMNFNMLGALTTADVPAHEASRPFSVDRSGFVRGEAAAALVLESRDEAEKRHAKVFGIIAGYGNTTDAFRLTDGRDDGSAVIRSMKTAIQDAGLSANDVEYINAHGTSTPLNDRLETLAIKNVFGPRAYQIPVSSLKSQVGHSTVASGAVEAIACLLMLQEQKIAPTINYRGGDPDCDLDYVPNQSRPHQMNTVLSNNFGFGGQNACLVFKRNM